MRRFPIPPVERTIHLVGDTHFGAITDVRRDRVRDDCTRPQVPQVATRVQLGDLTNNSTSGEDLAGVAFMESLGGTPYYVVGNHDAHYGVRSANDAALAWGMPGKDYTVDLGYALLVVTGFDVIQEDNTSMSWNSTTLNWLNDVLSAATKPVIICAHPPLFKTVTPVAGTEGQYSSNSTPFSAQPDADIRAVLDDWTATRTIAWVSGHTHSPIFATDLVKDEQVGGGTLMALNTSCIAYVGVGSRWYDDSLTMFLTVTDDEFLVRFRNHGAHQWVSAMTEGIRTWRTPFVAA